MTEFRRVTPMFCVAGQITPADVPRAAAAGCRVIVSNRPDGEAPDQTAAAEIAAAAAQHDLAFVPLPFAGPPPPAAVAALAELLDRTPGAVLAYCRTGRRSIMAWALAQAFRGAMTTEEVIQAAAAAGYDLRDAREALVALAQKP
jgi:sulfide:quinone oxidoreductase